MDPDFVSIQKHAKKELGQYPAILTSRLVNNPYILITYIWKKPKSVHLVHSAQENHVNTYNLRTWKKL